MWLCSLLCTIACLIILRARFVIIFALLTAFIESGSPRCPRLCIAGVKCRLRMASILSRHQCVNVCGLPILQTLYHSDVLRGSQAVWMVPLDIAVNYKITPMVYIHQKILGNCRQHIIVSKAITHIWTISWYMHMQEQVAFIIYIIYIRIIASALVFQCMRKTSMGKILPLQRMKNREPCSLLPYLRTNILLS